MARLAFAAEDSPTSGCALDPAQVTPSCRTRPSLAATKRMDIDRHRLDGDGVEAPFPGRHDTVSPIGDGLDQGGFIRAILPDLIGQVRRTDIRIALCVVTVAGRAVLRKDLGAGAGVVTLPFRNALQRPHIARLRHDLVPLQDTVLAEREHLTVMGLGIARPGAIANGLLDLFQGATPTPVVVVEVRVTLGAGRTGAMAGGAIVTEHGLAARTRQRQQRWILLDIGERGVRKRRHLLTADLLQIGKLDRKFGTG